MTRLIWWLRRDLRLDDNTALLNALHNAEEVTPVYILDAALLRSSRARNTRLAWLLDGLRALDADLRALGASLVVRRGDPAAELLRLCAESGASGVYFNRDYSQYAVNRDEKVRAALERQGLTVCDFKDLVIHEIGEVLSASGKTYEVYTPFKKAWNPLPKPRANEYRDALTRLRVPPDLASLPIPDAAEFDAALPPEPIALPGESQAKARLAAFVAGPIYRYADTRNALDRDGTSILSPYLRWGMISPRQAYWAADTASQNAPDAEARAGVASWISELVWREFNYSILTARPGIVRRNFRPVYDSLPWENNPAFLAAWAEGRTGYPIVDAAMRQMNATGWMHNRARMIAASFLCKDLLIDWRLGEQIFMERLLDGDVANNVGGWQWVAGTGTDAAPYFRIFNPTTQGEKFDPDGIYIRRWLPELRDVPTESIHQPWQMRSEAEARYNSLVQRNYPRPIVDHAQQRERALAMYGVARADRP